jgi:hypothetical protein
MEAFLRVFVPPCDSFKGGRPAEITGPASSGQSLRREATAHDS